ncbi:hypothetical protein LptCag_1621 [Leptospirillum ferriphilum]|jgi:type II secretory pathway pseudopilin PulG|uniref:Uncharacterized protein n=2 Tax=Leptospirillum TaxID=179 RepID=A0A094WAU7_9BACT|nr:hypothetical protein LptCag_1621 [Leptospirillum ferriphilum]
MENLRQLDYHGFSFDILPREGHRLPDVPGYSFQRKANLMRWLVIILIFSVLGVGYLVVQSGQNAQKLGKIQNQVSTLQSQLNKEKRDAIKSLQGVKRSLHLHMAESSIEDAVRDILDQNYGQADSAIQSARDNIKKAHREKGNQKNLSDADKLLGLSLEQARNLDPKTVSTLNEADRDIRKEIAGTSNQ